MRWTGIIIAPVPHLPPGGSHVGQREPGLRARRSVQQPGVQLAARRRSRSSTSSPTIALAFHLYHGAWSMFQSLGINNPRYNTARRRFAQGFAGDHPRRQPVSFPIAVQLGLGRARVPAHRSDHRPVHARSSGRMTLDSKIPEGPLDREVGQPQVRRSSSSTRRTSAGSTIIVVGTGLAGASAAATLGELGYNVKVITFHDSPRRAHSIAAQGGINAAKNYQNDGDSIYRLFYDTIKGGDYRAREGERVPARAGVGRHHRPVRRAGRAVRARVRRPARQPLASAARRCRARSTRGARPASSCCSARTRR